jgi:hypothetical protein
MSENEKRKMPRSREAIRRAALGRVREEYENIAHMSRLSLDQINRAEPVSRHYRSVDEYLRIWFSRAEAVSSFAVNLGLISPQQALQVIHEFQDAHPELVQDTVPGTDQEI